MASINYPFPYPKNAAEREANRQAADDYQHQINPLGNGRFSPACPYGRNGTAVPR
ncbi:hypothetical protein GCM10010121_087670 [Streptomyces brasiliensis]|uniref:Uncharacterized protein n=1 Tax=Streptomyces brasiliensis TaxID=1954 RepID=A0A917P657_9ACTN|nr:hypothetical protein GCM10010121_087670 [Streptomyces brasiliensis]